MSIEVLAAVTGVILYRKYKHTTAKYFIFFLVYVIVTALIARYTLYVKNNGPLSFLDGTLMERNYWWFTICWKITAVVFFGWYYLKVLNNAISKRILKISLIGFSISSMLIILLTLPDFFTKPIPLISILGAIIILQCVYFYFMEILQSENILTFYKSLTFYISVAILLYWLIKTPLVFYEQYYRKLDMNYVSLRRYINLFVILFMYTTFTIGLIVSKPDKNEG
ncbi:hypothetical protein [Lacinutrix sp. WUR7]|uniref:hypothetical protein n=1 Tax=Lacinutrix sp. WUR7 TaxID=2653681 RepID=UPI001EEFD799|nr:hypothetical protein [Lacinutrix sp. WUR7]